MEYLFGIEKQNLQRGMNFRCNPEYSILLMSTRNNAPFEDEIVADGRVLIYEGHNAYKNHTDKDPYTVDQPRHTPNGKLTDNGKFEKDKLAILSMEGQYRVYFDFMESMGFVNNFQPQNPIKVGELNLLRS